MDKKNQLQINRDTNLLAPIFRDKVLAAIALAKKEGYEIGIFEGYRSPTRQDHLFSQGRSTPGKIVTKAKAYQSAHQFGLACDIAFYFKSWTWDNQPFDKLVPIFTSFGLKNGGKNDIGHYEYTGNMTVKECYQYTLDHGLLALWHELQNGTSKS